MSAPPVPDLGSATLSVLRLSWTRLVRGRKLRLGITATVLVLLAAIIARYAAEGSVAADVVEAGVRVGFFGLLVYMLPFLFTSGTIAEEVEGRTFPFLALRPAGRVAIVLGKYLAGAGMSVILLASGILVLHVAAYATDPTPMIDELPGTLRTMGAISLLALCYSAICLFWGSIVVEAAGLLSTLHLATIEFGFSWLPSFLRFGSMNYLAAQLAGLPKGGFFPEWVPDIETWICGVVIAIVTLVFVGMATLVVRTTELGFGKA
jgi:ABC-type transport system involved in multi-copper enzyme maturation permease subunit